MIAKEAVEKWGDLTEHAVGTGPFIMTSWKPDQEIVLKRNPNYWQYDSAGNRLPLLDEVVFTMIKDDKTLLAKFDRGEMEEDFTLPTETFRNIVTEQKTLAPGYEKKAVLQHVPALNSYFLDFLCTGKLFSNLALRRALSFAVDRDKIVRYVLKGAPHGIANHGIVPPAFERYPIQKVHGIEFDLDSARIWLEKAGYPNGKGLPTLKLAVYNEPRPMQIAEAIQAQWKDIGIDCELQVMQSGLLLTASDEGKLDLWLTRWYADYPEIENFLNLFNGRLVPKNPAEKSYPNNTRWNNERYNPLFYQALSTTDEAQRLDLYAQAEDVAAFEAPNIPLFYEEHYRLLQPYVRDNPLDAMNRIDLKTVWLDK
jgi:peptide/nickel transport system substrate-binding protein